MNVRLQDAVRVRVSVASGVWLCVLVSMCVVSDMAFAVDNNPQPVPEKCEPARITPWIGRCEFRSSDTHPWPWGCQNISNCNGEFPSKRVVDATCEPSTDPNSRCIRVWKSINVIVYRYSCQMGSISSGGTSCGCYTDPVDLDGIVEYLDCQ